MLERQDKNTAQHGTNIHDEHPLPLKMRGDEYYSGTKLWITDDW